MKKHSLIYALLAAMCLSGCSSQKTPTYTITWRNYDGTILEVDEHVKRGSIPTYNGADPTKPDDSQYTYTWNGWSPEVTAARSDQTYTATFVQDTIKYTINFDLNGGSSASYTGSKVVEYFTKDVFFFDCVKTNWNFRGWSYNGVKIFDEKGNQLANPVMAKSMTFVAMYAQTAKMTIVSNLEGAGTITGQGEYPYNTYVDVSAYANQGYEFVGWYYEDTLLSNTNDYKYMMWSEDVTLEARFKLASFLMSVHTNNQDYGLVLLRSTVNNNYLPQYEEYREYTTPVTVAAYSKTDTRFLGWYDTKNRLVETNAVYNFVMPNYDYTLEAKWNYFTVSYVLNGGTNNSSNPTSYTIDSNRITLFEPTRTGYDFVGWTYNGTTVTEIDPSWIDNITLVANWSSHIYSITYELNDGTNNSSNPSSYTIESNTITLQDATRNGYTFAGWYKTSTFSNKVTTISSGSHGDLILYAKWTPISYSITYVLDGGTNDPNNPSTYTIESEFAFAAPTKIGYTFLGWFDNNGHQVTLIAVGTTGALSLTAHWNDGDAFTATLDPNSGSVSQTSFNVQYDHSYSLPTPSRLGYTFDGWYDGSTKVNNSGTWKYTTNKTFVAHWTIINYSIYYILNGGTNRASNPSTYTIEDSVTFTSPIKTGYTFLGWFDNSGNQITSIAVGSTGSLTLIARWNDGDMFTATLNANNGDVSPTSLDVQYDHTYVLPDATRPGYTFDGWYDGSTKIKSTGTWKYTTNKTFIAHWVAVDYSITYTLNGGTNNSANTTTYTIEDNIIFAAPTKTGYTFDGWYSNNEIITGIDVGSTGIVDLEARWSADLNSLSVTSEDTSKGTVAIASGSGYSDETITVVATPVNDYVFRGWYHESTKVSDNPTYTFTMPTNDYSLVAHFFTAEEAAEEAYALKYATRPFLSDDGKTVTYGLYPQENVNDASIISALNSISTPESNGWYLYDGDYYAKVIATPYSYSTGNEFNNGTTITTDTTYWFKCEPIVWNVLSNNDGQYYLLSSFLLDAYCYYYNLSNREINRHTVYPSNYQYSAIRDWLNADFYNSAFALGNNSIQTTNLRNLAYSQNGGYPQDEYSCDNTEDKVFLPSFADYCNESYGFTSSTEASYTRYCITTDWAKARGASFTSNGSGYYWTRSACNSSSAWAVSGYDGRFDNSILVKSKYSCVRPAITITLY